LGNCDAALDACLSLFAFDLVSQQQKGHLDNQQEKQAYHDASEVSACLSAHFIKPSF